MASKADIKEVEYLAKEAGLSPEQRREFSRYLHKSKMQGHRGTKNDRGDYTREELREMLREFKGD